MAVVFNPLLSQEAHGKIGGTEFRQIRGRSIVGRVSLATPQRTLRTNPARQIFDWAVKGWRDLSDADRALWAAAADSPELGFQLWTQRAIATLTIRDAFPSCQADAIPPSPITWLYVSANHGSDPAIAALWDIADPQSSYLIFYWQPQQRTSPKPSPFRWRLLGTADPLDSFAYLPTPVDFEYYHFRMHLVGMSSGIIYQSLEQFLEP
jgi:hypothetical protein